MTGYFLMFLVRFSSNAVPQLQLFNAYDLHIQSNFHVLVIEKEGLVKNAPAQKVVGVS